MGMNFGNFEPFSTQCPLGGARNHVDASGIFTHYGVLNTMRGSQYPLTTDNASATELRATRFCDAGSDHRYLPWVVLDQNFPTAYDPAPRGGSIQLSECPESLRCGLPECFESSRCDRGGARRYVVEAL